MVYGQPVPDPAPQPPLPDGYTIRAVRGVAEVEQRVAVQRAAFESTWMTAERHDRVRNSPTYRPELDIVVVAPDGEFAAFALLWFDEANRLGVFEPLGVAPAYQRLGLGRAIMASTTNSSPSSSSPSASNTGRSAACSAGSSRKPAST